MAQKLGEELKYETEAAQPAEPEFLKAFKAQGTWAVSFSAATSRSGTRRVLIRVCFLQIEDAAGMDEVTLTRKFGNEECVSPRAAVSEMAC